MKKRTYKIIDSGRLARAVVLKTLSFQRELEAKEIKTEAESRRLNQVNRLFNALTKES